MYTLQAILGHAGVFEANRLVACRVVRLGQGMAIIPLAEGARLANGIPLLPLTDGGEAAAPESIVAICRALSARGRLAYVEAEFFGGKGTQACVLAKEGEVEVPYVGGGAINRALQFLGVARGQATDEFEALSLGRHRDTEEWESEPGA